jgi:hypothetical protein
MADTRILDYVAAIDGPAPGAFMTHEVAPSTTGLEVSFERFGSARLADSGPTNVAYRSLIERMRRIHHPVAVSMNETRVITDVIVPFVGLVIRMTRASDGSFQVGLNTSAIRFLLEPNRPNFSTMRKFLQEARTTRTPVVIQATRTGRVIEEVGSDSDLQSFRAGEIIPRPIVGNKAIALASQVGAARATTLFNDMFGEDCGVGSGPTRCIPFQFPDDGCWARADRMCDLLQRRHGLRAVKVWIHGNLRASTFFSPFCRVTWDWHVAPALRRAGEAAHLTILDPAVFDEPVSRARWKAEFGDRNARISVTDASVFSQSAEGVFEREPKGQLDFDLDKYQGLLEERVALDGPPPYDCRF